MKQLLKSKSIILCIGYALLLTIFYSACTSSAASDSEIPSLSIFDKLCHGDLIEFDLISDFNMLESNKADETYQPARFVCHSIKDAFDPLQIKISARGFTRKNYCDNVPIRLKFPKEVLQRQELSDIKTLKLVRPCKDSLYHQDLVFREFLCYKLYELISDYGFRVQLAKVNLIHESNPAITQYAFLIEHKKQLAQRHEAELLDTGLGTSDRFQYGLMTIFQYMIGNTDWNLSLRHNLEMIYLIDEKRSVPIPYDFDYSGLVNANYATPYPTLPVATVKDRFFQWRGQDYATLLSGLQHFNDKKEAVYDLLSSFTYISDESRAYVQEYIASFYQLMEDENNLLGKILNQ